MRNSGFFAVGVAMLLGACAGGPPAPDWAVDAQHHVRQFTEHYLAGETRLAPVDFDKAIAKISASGDLALAARLELVRCGLMTAALDFTNCEQYAQLAQTDMRPADAAYHRFLSGDWTTLDRKALPDPYAELVVKADAPLPEVRKAVAAIDDPVSRLVAAGVSVRRNRFDDALLTMAADTASERGWRRPLLAYLGLLKAAAQARGETSTVDRLEARMRLVTDKKALPTPK